MPIRCSWLIALYLLFSFAILSSARPVYYQLEHRATGISIIIDVGEVDECLNFLKKFNYSKWSVVLTTGLIESGILDNSSFDEEITKYGEVLPGLWLPQTLDDAQRIGIVEDFVSQWEAKLGYKPYGFFMFQPDTYTCDYLYSRGMLYVQGYCLDQYAIDWMTMRGGWQQPYYASSKNVLVPSSSKGIVVLPHAIWDYRDSFEIDHQYDSQPADAYRMFGGYEDAKNYVLKLMDEVLAKTEPIAYFVSQNEIFGWGGQFKSESLFNHTDFFRSIIDNAISCGATVEMFNETATWFSDQFSENPVYHVTDFVSPYSGRKSDWYWDSDCRVTRYDDYVVGYVEYGKQNEDPCLQSTCVPGVNPHDPEACINTSLNFTIDDFGNGRYRLQPLGNRVLYLRNLQDFQSYWRSSVFAKAESLKTVIGQGCEGNVSIAVRNQGNFTEDLKVAIYANATIIITLNSNLTSGSSETMSFVWNTSGLAYGDYTISAYAWPVSQENDTTNYYTLIGFVHVGLPGDVSGRMPGVYDGTVNIRDIAFMITLFNTKPTSCNWNPNVDVNNDGVCNMRDIVTAMAYFNQHE
jgi:hypothetical protein